MGKTISEKILSRVTGEDVSAGDIVYPEPELVTVHDWYVVNFDKALRELGVDRLHDPDRVLICTDHEPVAVSPQAVARQKQVRDIVRNYGITHFFDAGRGGHGHVFPIELGLITPGMFVEAYDVHVTNYGAVGALGIPVVVEITEVLACGSVWLRVPDTVRVNLTGSLGRGVGARDAAQKLIKDLGAALVDYSVVEFGGPALDSIDLAGRHTLCNTPIDIGAKSALIEPDRHTLDYLAPRVDGPVDLIASDPDAAFRAVVDYDLDAIEPQVAVPPTPDCVVGISEVAGRTVHHAFIGLVRGREPRGPAGRGEGPRRPEDPPSVCVFIVTPGTQEVMAAAQKEGVLPDAASRSTPGAIDHLGPAAAPARAGASVASRPGRSRSIPAPATTMAGWGRPTPRSTWRARPPSRPPRSRDGSPIRAT